MCPDWKRLRIGSGELVQLIALCVIETYIQQMNVRRLTPSDIDSLFALRLKALEESPDAFLTSLEEDKKRGPDRFLKTLEHSGPDKFALGAFNEEMLVASAFLFQGERIKDKHSAYVHGMYVDPDFRKNGLGGEILDFALAHAKKEMKVQMVFLSVVSTNTAAIELYQSRGFTSWGIQPGAYISEGKFSHENHMALAISGPA